MSSIMQSQFAISDKQLFDFTKPQEFSDSDEEELFRQNMLANNKEAKKQKKLIDIEGIKAELNSRVVPEIEGQKPRSNKKTSLRSLSQQFVPTSSFLIEQLGNIKAFKIFREQVPPEVLHKVYAHLRYQYIPAFSIVYRQGDQNKRFYVVLDGRCVVMKPKEKMVGISQVEIDIDAENQAAEKKDPYGVKSLFPDYAVVKALFPGDSFGEVAIKLEITRASTVFAVEHTHLLYLSEAAYKQLLDPYLSKILDDKIEFFMKNSIFTSVETELNDIAGILLECHLMTYKAGDIIYEEGSKASHIYFIVTGQVELSKKLGSKNLVLSSYGELQQFGEVEILNKTIRFTKARVITPRLIVYQIRKQRFFNNLGNFLVYENMKRKAHLMFNHWQLIYTSAKSQNSKEGEAYLSTTRRKTFQKKKKTGHSVNQSVSQVSVFQHMTEGVQGDYEEHSQDNPNLQKAYSNALQQYQSKLKKLHPPQNDNSGQNKQQFTNFRVHTENRASPKSKSKHDQSKKFSFHVKLPTISPNKIIPQMNLDQVLDSISKLPKVTSDNLVLSLMYQQAYKSNNPDKKAKQIQQVIQASFRNVRKQFEIRDRQQSKPRFKSTDSLLKNLRMSDGVEESKYKDDYLNFVHSKKIF